jgi:PAS domain S-box-containing protein
MSARILIVEDEAIVAKDIERNLRRWDYVPVGFAASGEEALRLAAELTPDLVLMDIKLRGEMDGIQTATRLRGELNCPVIYLTAHSDEVTLERARVARPYGYILKPIDYPSLRATIEIALYTHTVGKQLHESEEKHALMLRATLDGFWVNDLQGNILDVNDAYCAMSGYSRAELLHMAVRELEYNEDALDVSAHLERIIRLGADRFETRHITKSGAVIDVDVSVNYLESQKLFFAFVRDITERKQAERRISQLNLDLKRRVDENARLYESERDQREFAEMLAQASEALASRLDLDAVLDLIITQIGRIVKNDVCNIVLLDGEQTKTVRSLGYEEFNAGSFMETFVFPLSGETVRQQILKTGKAIVVTDVRKDARFGDMGAAWLRSYVAAPISAGKQVIGFINVGSARSGSYNQLHARRLQAFAHHAAVAIHNARLYQDVQENAQRLQSLSYRLLEVQETERRYIARELHDEIGQSLTAAKLNVQALMRLAPSETFLPKLTENQAILDLLLQQVRNMSLDLHPSMLDDLGLVPALRWCADRESRWGQFGAQVIAETDFDDLPAHIALVFFRVTQEALTNIARHAEADEVTVHLWRRANGIHLAIRDNGRGFNVQEALTDAAQGNSLGLLGMQERVTLVNGILEINSSPSGTEIHVRVPLEKVV